MKNKNVQLIPDEYIERAKKLGVAELCDAVTALKLNLSTSCCMEPGIQAVSDTMKVVGTAVTVDTKDGDNFPIHMVCYEPDSNGYVLVIAGKNFRGRAYAGDLIFASCQAAGYEGFVIDGCTRDKLGNISIGFPVWSRGFNPNSPIKKEEGDINTPIVCAGVNVNPGDLVVGDADGVCVIPREHIPQVLEKAEAKEAYEQNRRIHIAQYVECREKGEPLPQLAPQWVIDFKAESADK